MSDIASHGTHDIAHSTNKIFYVLMIFVAVVVLAVIKWGAVALAMAALSMVPVVFILLIAVTFG